jgi:hypothetical protein
MKSLLQLLDGSRLKMVKITSYDKRLYMLYMRECFDGAGILTETVTGGRMVEIIEGDRWKEVRGHSELHMEMREKEKVEG